LSSDLRSIQRISHPQIRLHVSPAALRTSPAPRFIGGVNAFDTGRIMATFADDAMVSDNHRESRGGTDDHWLCCLVTSVAYCHSSSAIAASRRDSRSALVVTRDGVLCCPRGHRHRCRCGQRWKSRQNYAGIISVHQPLAFSTPVGAMSLRTTVAADRCQQSHRRRRRLARRWNYFAQE
jgi:hypothetical protein